MNEEIGLSDICTPAKFEKDHPNLFEGKGSTAMDTLIRNRHANGLTDCGAIVEPVQRRPMVVPPKFLRWLLGQKRAAQKCRQGYNSYLKKSKPHEGYKHEKCNNEP